MGRQITHDIDGVAMRSDAFAGERSRPRSPMAAGLYGAPNRTSDKPASARRRAAVPAHKGAPPGLGGPRPGLQACDQDVYESG